MFQLFHISKLEIKNSNEKMLTLGRYSVTIIMGELCVTAPKNWTTFG